MLNKDLYDWLNAKLGPFKVLKEDRPACFEQAKTAKFGKGKNYRGEPYVNIHPQHWGEIYQGCCPCCGDTRNRLFVSHLLRSRFRIGKDNKPFRTGPYLFKCWNEGCDVDQVFTELDMPRVFDLGSLPMEKRPRRRALVSIVQESCDLPKPSWPLANSECVPEFIYAYLQSRRYDPAELAVKFGLRYVPSGSEWVGKDSRGEEQRMPFYEPRILIPIIQHRRLLSWQARLPYDGEQRKYIFPPDCTKSAYLYNFDRALLHKDIVLFEGCPSVWRFGGMNAVSCFGKSIDDQQLELMRAVWSYNGRLLIVLDPDTYGKRTDSTTGKDMEMAARIRDAKIFPRGVYYVRIPQQFIDEDPDVQPDRLTRQELHEIVDRAWAQIDGKAYEPKADAEDPAAGPGPADTGGGSVDSPPDVSADVDTDPEGYGDAPVGSDGSDGLAADAAGGPESGDGVAIPELEGEPVEDPG